jgi:leucyl/phenylalanyl-tRNA--protein transferase
LEVQSLLLAYRSGIFPWPISEEFPLTWFSPPERALLFLSEYRPSKSFQKFLKKTPFTVRIDTCFSEVIRRCSEERRKHRGTWITEAMIEAYGALHRAGAAHSFECFHGERLVGGLYGVAIGGAFAGESMFHLEANASKLALHSLILTLRERGALWIDCQMLTPLLESVGAREVPRAEYLSLLAEALTRPPLF